MLHAGQPEDLRQGGGVFGLRGRVGGIRKTGFCFGKNCAADRVGLSIY
jgi:hypothetical protein